MLILAAWIMVVNANNGSTFRTAVVIDFGQKGRDNATGLEAYAQTIGDTFRDAINSLYKNDGKTCNPNFRVVESAQATILQRQRNSPPEESSLQSIPVQKINQVNSLSELPIPIGACPSAVPNSVFWLFRLHKYPSADDRCVHWLPQRSIPEQSGAGHAWSCAANSVSRCSGSPRK
jgi:hypothetical protein